MFRKLISLMFVLCLIPLGAAFAAGEAKTVYASDFSKDEDGWYGRGAQSFRTAEGTVKTEGRTSDWNSPGRDFDLVEGAKYRLSVEVRQDEIDQATGYLRRSWCADRLPELDPSTHQEHPA